MQQLFLKFIHMETSSSYQQPFKLDFHGKGSEFFGIIIVNWLLTVITLGFYYPWAKAKQLKYLYSATSFNNDRFQFSGTGNEMFIGFIKTLLIMIVLGVNIVANEWSEVLER